MHRAFRFLRVPAGVLALAGLAACGTVPMGSYPASYPTTQTQSQYPAQTPAQTQYPAQSQYPAQYPNQYPNQYPAQTQPSNATEYGRVTNLEVFQAQQQAQASGIGAVLGGVAGAVVGRQIGGGTGRDIATVAGAVGGALAGNALEKNSNPAAANQTHRVTVQLDRGGARAYDLPANGGLRIGDRVRIQNGQLFRY